MAKQAIRGVNLGGWLVLEPWITPSLFKTGKVSDEYTLCNQFGDQHLRRLKLHRETFVAERDFQWLANHHIQAVRIPVGYWLFGDQPPFVETVSYLDKAFGWAAMHGLKVLVCLHGAPGSQNGQMHSGRAGATTWHVKPENIEQTLGIIKQLAVRYKGNPALLGIELLNEPSPDIPKPVLNDYYKRAYKVIRQICGRDAWVVFSDSFQLKRWAWNLHWPFWRSAYVDSHQYQLFTPADKAMDIQGHLAATSRIARQLKRTARHRRIIIGEWSLALDAQSLRELDNKAIVAAYQAYATAQCQAYSKADAWFYWTYTTEDDGPWSFKANYQDIV